MSNGLVNQQELRLDPNPFMSLSSASPILVTEETRKRFIIRDYHRHGGKCVVPMIDRRSPLDTKATERSRSSKIPVLAVVLLAVLMLVAVAGLIVQIGNSTWQHQSETPVRAPARIAYATHNPILIIGNTGFTNECGVVWGSGTDTDPFLIQGWDINASTANGIEIRNASAHFIVRDCHIHDGRFQWESNYSGICLWSCVNGTLDSNNCTDNREGIYLNSSSKNTIINNTCSGAPFISDVGIILEFCSDNSLVNNTCFSNVYCGLSVSSSSGNIFVNNNCSNNRYEAMYFSHSDNNILANNRIYGNGDVAIGLYSDSSNNILVGNTAVGNYYGIALIGSANGSNFNVIANNYISNTHEYGLDIGTLSCRSNTIWNNTFVGNNGATDIYDASHIQAFDGGWSGSNWWNRTGGYGNYWSDWTAPDSNNDGIVDNPYLLDGWVVGDGGYDYFPLTTTPTEPIPEFAMMPLVVVILLVAVFITEGARRRKAP
jgi:parallel beta-helix repeat protein